MEKKYNIHWYRPKRDEDPLGEKELTMIERHADINAVKSYCPKFDPLESLLNGSTPGRVPGKDGQLYHIVEVAE